MPTAGEFKHEPFGIPCHCYVKRRLHHSTCLKSCLRKQSDSSSQSCSDTKPKKVTFNPILRIRSFDNLLVPHPTSNPPLRNAKKSPDRNTSRDKDGLSNPGGIRTELTSLLGLNQSCRSSRNHDTGDRGACDQNNNAIEGQGDTKMNSKCPICESKRHKSPVRGYHYQKTRERSPSPCGFHQPYQTATASKLSQQRQQKSAYNLRVTPSLPASSKYHVPRRLFGHDSYSETSSQKDSSGGYEHMNTLTYVASTATDLDGSSVYINGDNDNKTPRPVSIFIRGDREEDKLDEYIYEIPINTTTDEVEYDYVTIDAAQRTQSDPNRTQSFTRLIKHKTEADLTSKNIEGYTLRPKYPSPRSAPDLRTIGCPRDIHLVDDEQYQRRSSEEGDEQVEMFAASDTEDKLQMSKANKSFQYGSAFVDILKMTPIAFFWTGCAFLIAIMYIVLFPCPYEHK